MHRNAWHANVIWGIRWGMVLAAVAAFFALLTYLTGGSSEFHTRNTTLLRVLGGYVLAGVTGGALFGMFRPVVDHLWGAILAGIGVAFPIAFALTLMFGATDGGITGQDFGIMTFIALIGGPIWGLIGWACGRAVKHRR